MSAKGSRGGLGAERPGWMPRRIKGYWTSWAPQDHPWAFKDLLVTEPFSCALHPYPKDPRTQIIQFKSPRIQIIELQGPNTISIVVFGP